MHASYFPTSTNISSAKFLVAGDSSNQLPLSSLNPRSSAVIKSPHRTDHKPAQNAKRCLNKQSGLF